MIEIGDLVRVPDDAKYGIHAGLQLMVTSLDAINVQVECEDEHVFLIPRDDLDLPDPSEVIYVLTVADANAQAGRSITRIEFEQLRKSVEYSTIPEAWSEVCFAVTGSDRDLD